MISYSRAITKIAIFQQQAIYLTLFLKATKKGIKPNARKHLA